MFNINKENAEEIIRSYLPVCDARIEDIEIDQNELKATIWIKVPPMIQIDFTVNKDGTITYDNNDTN